MGYIHPSSPLLGPPFPLRSSKPSKSSPRPARKFRQLTGAQKDKISDEHKAIGASLRLNLAGMRAIRQEIRELHPHEEAKSWWQRLSEQVNRLWNASVAPFWDWTPERLSHLLLLSSEEELPKVLRAAYRGSSSVCLPRMAKVFALMKEHEHPRAMEMRQRIFLSYPLGGPLEALLIDQMPCQEPEEHRELCRYFSELSVRSKLHLTRLLDDDQYDCLEPLIEVFLEEAHNNEIHRHCRTCSYDTCLHIIERLASLWKKNPELFRKFLLSLPQGYLDEYLYGAYQQGAQERVAHGGEELQDLAYSLLGRELISRLSHHGEQGWDSTVHLFSRIPIGSLEKTIEEMTEEAASRTMSFTAPTEEAEPPPIRKAVPEIQELGAPSLVSIPEPQQDYKSLLFLHFAPERLITAERITDLAEKVLSIYRDDRDAPTGLPLTWEPKVETIQLFFIAYLQEEASLLQSEPEAYSNVDQLLNDMNLEISSALSESNSWVYAHQRRQILKRWYERDLTRVEYWNHPCHWSPKSLSSPLSVSLQHLGVELGLLGSENGILFHDEEFLKSFENRWDAILAEVRDRPADSKRLLAVHARILSYLPYLRRRPQLQKLLSGAVRRDHLLSIDELFSYWTKRKWMGAFEEELPRTMTEIYALWTWFLSSEKNALTAEELKQSQERILSFLLS